MFFFFIFIQILHHLPPFIVSTFSVCQVFCAANSRLSYSRKKKVQVQKKKKKTVDTLDLITASFTLYQHMLLLHSSINFFFVFLASLANIFSAPFTPSLLFQNLQLNNTSEKNHQIHLSLET